MTDKYKELERQLLEDEITPDEFTDKYNQYVDEDRIKEPAGQPHEHI